MVTDKYAAFGRSKASKLSSFLMRADVLMDLGAEAKEARDLLICIVLAVMKAVLNADWSLRQTRLLIMEKWSEAQTHSDKTLLAVCRSLRQTAREIVVSTINVLGFDESRCCTNLDRDNSAASRIMSLTTSSL